MAVVVEMDRVSGQESKEDAGCVAGSQDSIPRSSGSDPDLAVADAWRTAPAATAGHALLSAEWRVSWKFSVSRIIQRGTAGA